MRLVLDVPKRVSELGSYQPLPQHSTETSHSALLGVPMSSHPRGAQDRGWPWSENAVLP